MNHRSLGTLIVLNVVLLVSLLVVMLSPRPAQAQLRGRGEYAMLSGRAKGTASKDVVYIADLRSGQIVSFLFESSQNKLSRVGQANISRDLTGRSPRR